MFGFQDITSARIIVVHVTAYDTERVTNTLVFSKHTSQFLPDADISTIRILFSNDGGLNAIKSVRYLKNRGATFPNDNSKTVNHLIRQLLGILPPSPELRCKIEIAETVFPKTMELINLTINREFKATHKLNIKPRQCLD